ncbi:MAG: hypothetical protein R3338_11895, partial [Thermoanaerobaculia bacterium]|nr:hypothetical protein [Thermoanaerobaculia bacterium]
MSPRLVLALLVLSLGCTTTAPQEEAEPEIEPVQFESPIPAEKPDTDPRLRELDVRTIELLDRLEVLRARVNRMEDILLELAQPEAG